MNIFEEIHSRLNSKAKIRALFKDTHVEDLEKLIKRLTDVTSEKKEAKRKQEEQMMYKKNNIKAVKQIMEEKGVSLSDLGILDFKELSTKQRKKLKKYVFEFEDNSGNKSKWTGATTGRLPKDFQDYLDRTGKRRTDCISDNI